VGPGQRASQGVIVYRLGAVAAKRRAGVTAAVRAVTALAPVVLAAELLPRLGWSPAGPLLAVAAGLIALVIVRAAVQYGTAKRRLGSLRVTLDDDSLATETAADRLTVPRSSVARIVEIDGALGGIRVDSAPDVASGVVLSASVPRGGDGFGEVRARLEQWRTIERRGKAGSGVRLLLGVAVVMAMFFLPFVLDDFVARSKLLAGAVVVVAWAAIRWTMRGR
jgi:hypothetical protein